MCTNINLDEKVVKYNSDNIFFVSDFHFNHTKLCEGYEVHLLVPILRRMMRRI